MVEVIRKLVEDYLEKVEKKNKTKRPERLLAQSSELRTDYQ